MVIETGQNDGRHHMDRILVSVAEKATYSFLHVGRFGRRRKTWAPLLAFNESL